MDTASVTNIEEVAKSSRFLWKLLPFMEKRFYSLLYKPICGLFRILSYWKSIIATHKHIRVN